MCTLYMSNYYLYDFLKNYWLKIDKSDGVNDDLYILHIKRYAIRI
jgi:hypothetical protein